MRLEDELNNKSVGGAYWTRCKQDIIESGAKSWPRSCAICGLGPCSRSKAKRDWEGEADAIVAQANKLVETMVKYAEELSDTKDVTDTHKLGIATKLLHGMEKLKYAT